jgi:hypothetical protein
MCGLMHRLATSSTKEWALREGKDGNRTGKIKIQSWFILWKDMFSLHHFPSDVKSRRKLYFAGQCACK